MNGEHIVSLIPAAPGWYVRPDEGAPIYWPVPYWVLVETRDGSRCVYAGDPNSGAGWIDGDATHESVMTRLQLSLIRPAQPLATEWER